MNARVRAAGLAVGVVLCLTLASATPVPRPGSHASPGPVGQDPSASVQPVVEPPVGAVAPTQALQELARGDEKPSIDLDPAGNAVAITAPPGGSIPNPDSDGTDGFVRRYAGALGLNSSYTATRGDSHELPGGDTVVRYRQTAGGVPVLGGEIVVTAGAQGEIKGVVAEATQATPTSTTATVSDGEAGRVALAAAAKRFSLDPSLIKVGSALLWIYDATLIGAPGQRGARPTWWVEVVGPEGDKAATILVDATDASVSLAITAKREAGPNRIVCDLNGIEDVREFDLSDRNVYGCNDYSALGQQVGSRHEGGATSSVPDVNKAYDNLGVAQAFYQTNFGIDSFDGRGAQIRATVRACQADIHVPPSIYDYYCPFPNAFWDGQQLVFGQGYATDDVAAHEFTHAVIDHTSQLFYAYESGAINEAFADIMGEFVDQSFNGPGEDTSKLWLIGEDLPLSPGSAIHELRDMANPARLGQPATFFGANYYWGDNDNGGVHQNSGVANHLAFLIAMGGVVDADTFPGIGLEKSKLLWHRAMHLMPSGGDFRQLGRVLEQSCVELVGHFGFTPDNCFTTVRDARIVIGVNHGPAGQVCPNGSTPDPVLFQDDFEQRDKWTLTPGWSFIPSPEVPVSYAASGKGALYGFTPSNGPTGYATMRDPITFPTPLPNGAFLDYRVLAPSISISRGMSPPRWEYDNVNDGAGWQPLQSSMTAHGGEYMEHWIDISALAGQTVRLRVLVAPGDTDWLIDDVNVHGCRSTFYAKAYDVTTTWSGTTAVVAWTYESNPLDHFELSYDPPIPGAPTTLSGLGVVQLATRSVSLNGLDPAVAYTMTITLVDDQNHQPPQPVTVVLRSQPTALCMTNPPLPFHLFSPTKPPSIDGGCDTQVITPRRNG